MDSFILANGSIIRNGRVIGLTPNEAVLLGGLYKARGYCIPRRKQALWVWGSEWRWPDSWDNMLAVYHGRIRKKTSHCSFKISHKYLYGDTFTGELDVDASYPMPEQRVVAR